MRQRCGWAKSHPLLETYHDREWGVPTHDRSRLYEFLVLEGAQAGLSWLTVLKRREAYAQALDGFNPDTVSALGDFEVEEWMTYPGLIHHRGKIRSHLRNARAFLEVEQEWGGFDTYLRQIVGGSSLIHRYTDDQEVPSYDGVSEELSRDLRRRGFQFVGPTICYSYLQATGFVMDHIISCYRYSELGGR